MKHILLIFSAIIYFSACSAAQKTPHSATTAAPAVTEKPVKAPEFITWDKKMVDLGMVKKGEKRSLFFEFTNTSGQPVQIDIVDACDCTKVEFPRGQIAPNAKGRLDVTFDSSEKTAGETIGINIVFTNLDAKGNPVIESVEYKFSM
jgi:peptidoglycan-associated lipoprotein